MFSIYRTVFTGWFVFSVSVAIFTAEAAGQYSQKQQRPSQRGVMQPLQQGTQPGPMRRPQAMQQQGHGAPTAGRGETFCIVEVDHELQIVSKPSGLKDLKKRLEDDFKTATKAYQDAKKDKNNKGVTLPKPEKKSIKEIKSGIKTQEKAQEELAKLQADRDRGGDKKSKR